MSHQPVAGRVEGAVLSAPDLQLLIAQRRAIAAAIAEIGGVSRDIRRFNAEAGRYATYAAAWAATLLVADIVKTCMSTIDKRAAALFGAIDKSITQANKVLKLLGRSTITVREDVLKTVDPNLKGAIEFTNRASQVRSFVDKAVKNATGGAVPEAYGQIDLVVKVGLVMTQDTVLLMQAGQTQQQAGQRHDAAQAQLRHILDRLAQQFRRIDAEITRAVEKAQRIQRTA